MATQRNDSHRATSLSSGCAIVLPVALLLSGCDRSSGVDLDPVPTVGVQVKNVRFSPEKVTAVTRDGDKERPSIGVELDMALSKPQDKQTHVAVQLRCLVDGRTVASEWIPIPTSIAKDPGDKVSYRGNINLDPTVFAPLDTCEASFGHFVRTGPGAHTFTGLGDLCFQAGKLNKGLCPSGVLPRAVGGELPRVVDLALSLGPAAPPGKSVQYAPGKPPPKYTIRVTHALQRGSGDIPSTGHRIDASCATSADVVTHGVGYPSQAKDLAPGEYRPFEILWHFDDEPSACQIRWTLGRDDAKTEFAKWCWKDGKTTQGDCSPLIVAKPATVAPPAASAPAASASAASAPAGSASAR